MNAARWTRIAIGYLALVATQVGVWAQFAPRSFYDDFPGFGHIWVGVDGPYNEHLVRDVGGLNLALAVVLVAAWLTLSRPLVATAAVATLAYGVPHLAYHLLHTDGLTTGDVVASIGGLALFALIPAALIAANFAGRSNRERGSMPHRAPSGR
jgi:hypothetical protein